MNLRYFLATFVVMPALAVVAGMNKLLPPALWVGLALMSIAPPAPPATRNLRKSGDVNVGLAWQAEAFLISVVTIPLTVSLVAWMMRRQVDLSWQPMLLRGVLFFAGPMVLGLLVRRYAPAMADAMQKPLARAAAIALIALMVLVAIAGAPVVWYFGIGPVAVVTAFVAIAVGVGHVLGGPRSDTRVTLVAMLAIRFPVPAMILAQANGILDRTIPVVLVYVIVGAVFVAIYSRLSSRSLPAA